MVMKFQDEKIVKLDSQAYQTISSKVENEDFGRADDIKGDETVEDSTVQDPKSVAAIDPGSEYAH